VVYVDAEQFASELTPALTDAGMTVLGLLQPVEETRPTPALHVRIRRSGDMGDKLAVVEITADEAIVNVDETLITEDLADFLSEAWTAVSRDFIRRVI
jgi:hypothetical protein